MQINETAQSRSYTDGVSLATYKNSPHQQWADEATAFIAWRDGIWMIVYEMLANVQSGTIAQPTIDELISELPQITWPTAQGN